MTPPLVAPPGGAAAEPGPPDPSLTRRATLTYAASLLQHAARVFAALVVTPLVVRGLGAELYGAWVMIQQTVGYLAVSDMRPVGTLKHSLAVLQHRNDGAEKRRQVGAAIRLWAMTLPVMLVLSALVVWFAPAFVRVAPPLVASVRIALAITIAGVLLDRIVSLPASVLRGVNRDYEALWINGSAVLVTSLAVGGAVLAGWSLPGVAAVTAAGPLVVAALRLRVARRVLDWFGSERPTRAELRTFGARSAWLFLTALTSLLLMASDLLLAGLVLGPAAAAVFGMTSAVVRLAGEPIAQLVGSANAGVAGLCARGELSRVGELRRELHLVALALVGVLGTGVIAANGAFLRLWIGPEYYDGRLATLLVVLLLAQQLAMRVDATILDAMLSFGAKAWVMLGFGALALAFGAALAPVWGLAGLAGGLLLGRTGLLAVLPRLIERTSDGRIPVGPTRSMARLAGTVGALFGAAYAAAPRVTPATWSGFVVTATGIATVSAAVVWFGGLGADARRGALQRVRRGRASAAARA